MEGEKEMKEAWQMTKEEARDKEGLLRQEKNLAYQKADDLLKKAIGKKKIFVKGSIIAILLRKDEFIKYGSSYIWKSKITPNIQKALEDAVSIKKQASNKYAKEATPLNAHYQSVKKAIIEGKPVPVKVLLEEGSRKIVCELYNYDRDKFDGCFGYYQSSSEGCQSCNVSNRCRRIEWVHEVEERPDCFGDWSKTDVCCMFCIFIPLCREMKWRKENE